MPTDIITPRDERETRALGAGKRITIAIGVLGTALPALLAAFGGLDWITAHLPLLLTGLGSLVSGGVASWIAVRRMRVDKAAQAGAVLMLVALPALLLASGCICRQAWLKVVALALLPLALLTGCTGVYTPKLSAISFGLDSAQALSGLNVTRLQSAETNDYYEIILDSSSGQQSSGKVIDGIIAIGEIAARMKGLPVAGAAAAASAASGSLTASADVAPPEDDAQTVYSAAGYAGEPGPGGEGVYGRPSCARCRAYRAAHPEVAIVNIDDAGNRADMWAALRLRGHTGSSVSLPVQITADGYIQAAK